LSTAGVPAARILTVQQAVELEQLRVRGYFTDLPFPGHPDRTLRVSGNGVHLNRAPLRPSSPPPLLGEHNAEVETVEVDLATTTGEVSAP
jgi:crotonobetainyl-CoA:carnitine CoA-transferase CaiB-like acyl-CoA transferase